MVTMATAASLKLAYPKCTSTHTKDHACVVSLQSDTNKFLKKINFPIYDSTVNL